MSARWVSERWVRESASPDVRIVDDLGPLFQDIPLSDPDRSFPGFDTSVGMNDRTSANDNVARELGRFAHNGTGLNAVNGRDANEIDPKRDHTYTTDMSIDSTERKGKMNTRKYVLVLIKSLILSIRNHHDLRSLTGGPSPPRSARRTQIFREYFCAAIGAGEQQTTPWLSMTRKYLILAIQIMEVTIRERILRLSPEMTPLRLGPIRSVQQACCGNFNRHIRGLKLSRSYSKRYYETIVSGKSASCAPRPKPDS